MAKLMVVSTTDFTSQPLLQIDTIDFINGPGTTAVATFSGVQLGSPRISPQVLIDGSEGVNAIVVNGTGITVDLSGWRFANWGTFDTIQIRGTSLSETLSGSSQNDTIFGFNGNDRINGGAGADVIEGGRGLDRLDGGTGNDTLSYLGSSAGVTINLATGLATGGDAFADSFVNFENVTGSAYKDTLSGDAAANALKGESGNDVLNGGAGADVIEGGRGLDRLDGGTGNDTLSYLGSSAGVTINLATGLATGGDASGDKFSGFENVAGSSYDDNLTGDAGANALSGENGNDALSGGLGSDIITGGNGRDTMTGGGNADRFVFTAIDQSVVGSNRDVITDFNENEDLIDLSAIDAIPTTGLDDSFTFIGTDAFTAAGQVRYQISGGQTIIQVNQDGTLSPDMEIALTGTHVLDSADFIL